MGVVTLSSGLDVDIVKFEVKKKVDLMELKPVKIQLEVKNRGSSTVTANATVVGTQNNVEVYHQTLPVTVKKRSARKLSFPSYVPQAEGEIEWAAVIDDADPDFDEATAITKVVLGDGEGHHGDGDDEHRHGKGGNGRKDD
jgi:hypothetical protein